TEDKKGNKDSVPPKVENPSLLSFPFVKAKTAILNRRYQRKGRFPSAPNWKTLRYLRFLLLKEKREASKARCVRSRLSGRAGPPDMAFLLFGHGAAGAQLDSAGWVCVDPLKLSASVHDVKIDV